jgi:hypothetical protein
MNGPALGSPSALGPFAKARKDLVSVRKGLVTPRSFLQVMDSIEQVAPTQNGIKITSAPRE